jgi:hypothetical protein
MNNNNEKLTTSTKRRYRRNKINKGEQIEKIMAKIEADAEKKVINLNKTIKSIDDFKKPEIGDLLINIMKSGSDEFKEKTGRNMTYSEMREMFG